MPLIADLILVSGSNHEIKTASSSVYFFHVTRTGAEEYLKTAPIKPLRTRTTQGLKRTFETEYQVIQPFTLKMVAIATALGKKKLCSQIIIDVNPDAPIIELYGFGSFGYFKGRGLLQPNAILSIENLRELHQYRVLSNAVNPNLGCGTFTRRLIV